MGQDVELGIAPRDQLSVEPDDSVTVIEWD
jgi:hypothetical protein